MWRVPGRRGEPRVSVKAAGKGQAAEGQGLTRTGEREIQRTEGVF